MGSVRALTLAAMVDRWRSAGLGALTPAAALATGQERGRREDAGDVRNFPPTRWRLPAAMKAAKVGETITVRGNVAMSKGRIRREPRDVHAGGRVHPQGLLSTPSDKSARHRVRHSGGRTGDGAGG
jgi:hypothetical protein